MEPPGVGHVHVHRLFEPGSAAVRQLEAQLEQNSPLIHQSGHDSSAHQAVLTYDELFDARLAFHDICCCNIPAAISSQLGPPYRQASNCVGFDVLPSFHTLYETSVFGLMQHMLPLQQQPPYTPHTHPTQAATAWAALATCMGYTCFQPHACKNRGTECRHSACTTCQVAQQGVRAFVCIHVRNHMLQCSHLHATS